MTHRLSACLSFDFDAMSGWIVGTDNPAAISRGEFGAVAIPRILELLAAHDARATFFTPGHTALAYPELVREIRDQGHELAHHGWVHESPAAFDRAGECANFERGLDALDRVAGVRPIGYRAPAQEFSRNTIDVLLEYGMAYDSSCAGSDFTPYRLRRGDRWSKTDAYEFGAVADLVEVPTSFGLNDWSAFEFDPGWSTNQQPPRVVREIWQAEFDYAYANVPGGAFTLCLHPQVIGRGSRLAMLDGLVRYMKEHAGVAFETCGDCAARWRAQHPFAPDQAASADRD